MFTITVDNEITLHLVQEHHHPIIFQLLEDNRAYLQQYMSHLDKTLDDVHQRCLRSKEIFATRGTLITLIVYQGQPAGMINLHNQKVGAVSDAEIGYWLAEKFVGNGIITRATKTLVQYAFSQLNINRVVLGIATNNPRSYAIAERLGFILEGTLRQNDQINGEWIDHRIYSLLRNEWETPQQPPILSYQVEDKLDIRLIEKHHGDIVYALCDANREHIGEWLPWIETTNDVSDIREFIERSLMQYGANDGFQAGIWCDNQFVGMIGYHTWDFQTKQTEIGYWLAKDATGQGITTKCTRILVDYAFNTLNVNRVVIRCAVGNDKSCAVAKRLGFTHESVQRQSHTLHHQHTDMNVYAILAEEWKKHDASTRNPSRP